ncbi:signal peptidase I [Olsenella massiliensis]|uniref:signal peptidase I n=1 Tax=Olsenella massiliensis TaxID=1622075 RepID=UPI0009E99EA9|nr:signal peptidase I [Olsenella massiliensis]
MGDIDDASGAGGAHLREERRDAGALSWAKSFVVALVVVALLRAFVFGVYYVPSGSMLDTIRQGDQLVGEKVSYRFVSPRPGDVVTFDDPEDPGTTLIKRVVATAGQTVDIHDGKVYVDGVEQVEDYVEGRPTLPLDRHAPALAADVSYPYIVPGDRVWVMGDNRTNSLDSRYFGAVSVSSITSRALFIYWPFADARGL